MKAFEDFFQITPANPPNDGILFADLQAEGRSGHLGHALVEYAPGKVLAFYPDCSAEDQRWKGHSGYGWMKYKRSVDGGETWSEALDEPHSKALFDRHAGRTMMCEKAVCTASGRILLFYLTCDMITNGHIWEPYEEPCVAFSDDQGHTFSPLRRLFHEAGRVYDVLYHDGVIYVLFFANAELPGIAHYKEHEMRLYVSTDDGESFSLRAVLPFQSTLHTFYGTMAFGPDGELIVYTYDEKDEHNLKYLISRDKGLRWETNRRAFFARRLRNPQLTWFEGMWLIHGRSGMGGAAPGHFILYASEDGVHWDEGRYLRLREAGMGAYSNNLLVHAPDGRKRLMIQTSHAYQDNRTNVLLYWVDVK